MGTITQVQGVTPTELSQLISNHIKVALSEALKEAVTHQSSNDDLLTSKDVQKLLNISHVTLWRIEKQGLISFSKIGSKKLYRRGDIVNVLSRG